MRRIRKIAGAGLVALAVSALPAGAGAATTVGSNLAGTPNAVPSPNTSFVPGSQPPGVTLPFMAPAAGVIVQLQLKHASSGPDPGAYGFRVLSGGAGQFFTTTGAPAELPDFMWPPNDTPGTRLFIPSLAGVPKGIPIAAGSRMGMVRIGGTSNQGAQIWSNSSGGTARLANTVHNSGTVFYGTGIPDEIMLQYQIEPDTDGDGFGDETQDRCPTNAAIQSACPVPAAAPIKKCKKKRRKKGNRSANLAKKKKGCKRKRKKKR